MKGKINLILATTCHILVDYLCIMTLFNLLNNDTPNEMRMLYNILAFGTQAIIGYIVDISKNKWIGIIGAILVSTGSLIYTNEILVIFIIGMGNAMFHVGSSLFVIDESDGRLSDLGIFVSSGAIGVGLGTISYNRLASIVLIALSVLWGIKLGREKERLQERERELDFNIASNNHGVVFIAFICIIIRALGSGKSLCTLSGSAWIMVISISSCVGKAFGGILSDKFGARLIGVISMIVSMISIGYSFVIGAVGVVISIIAFNMSMPITLGVIIDELKNYKCFGFGLTTFGLLIGSMITLFQYKLSITKNVIEMICLSGIALVCMMYVVKGGRKENEI